jgi:predicted GIY-YIG superfamily endonuclease
LLEGVLTRDIEGKTYYALYFGKSNKGYRRFIQHSKGNIHTSTLRRTIHGLLTDEEYNKPVHEPQIDNILKDCYFEWAVIDKEEENLVECIEAICIVHGIYPLNIDGNPAINSKWREYMMNERGKVKDKK